MGKWARPVGCDVLPDRVSIHDFGVIARSIQDAGRVNDRHNLVGTVCHLIIDEIDLSKKFPIERFLHHFWVHSVARDERTFEVIIEASLKDTGSDVTEMLLKLIYSESDEQEPYNYAKFDLVVNRNGKFLHCGEPFWIIPKEK